MDIEENSVRHSGLRLSFTFTHADGAALPVLSIAVTAVLVTGEGGTLDAAAHLTAVLVPPTESAPIKHGRGGGCQNLSGSSSYTTQTPETAIRRYG